MFKKVKTLGVCTLVVILLSCSGEQQNQKPVANSFSVSDSIRTEHYNWKTPKYKTVKAYLLSDELTYQWIRNQDSGKRNFFEKIEKEKNVILSEIQINKIKTLFTVTLSDSLSAGADCFNPRHVIVYYDQEERPIAAILACFECDRLQTLPEADKDLNLYLYNFRPLFQELGLPVFDNPLQHQTYLDSLKKLNKSKK